jgi:hypothetical protein
MAAERTPKRSDYAAQTPKRSDYEAPSPKRRRRSAVAEAPSTMRRAEAPPTKRR